MTNKTKVVRYKGERNLQKGLKKMARKGYEVQDRTSRKAVWSWGLGIFTRKQIHTVTFVKTQEEAQS